VRRDQLPPNPRHTFVLGRYKVVYVATPKAACSSLKWVVADIGGEDLTSFRAVDGSPSPGTGSIHARRLWKQVPRLHELTDDELAEIHATNGWHVFAVVRHPATRLWSAWQQKVLLCAPHRELKVPAGRMPAPPTTTADLVEAFAEFVVDLAGGRFERLTDDLHFQSQHHVLAAERMPYTRVYTVSELDQTMRDLDAQVRAHGGDPVPTLPSSNETPLKALRSVFAPETLATIREIYADDYRAWFSHDEGVPSGTRDEPEFSPAVLGEVRRLMEENARLRDGARDGVPAR
jgi:hypothetical protein